jgi:hypothetical protein
MMIFAKARDNAEAIHDGGRRALSEARLAGVPAYYMAPDLGKGVVKEMPDGRRHLIQLVDGREVVLESFGPKAGQ